MESGVLSSLHQNCHHQLICAKINLKVFYPPPHECEIWHYQRENVDQIQRAIEKFSWEKPFRNSNINEMTVCSYHVTNAFQSESTLHICLNFKELLARNRRDV